MGSLQTVPRRSPVVGRPTGTRLFLVGNDYRSDASHDGGLVALRAGSKIIHFCFRAEFRGIRDWQSRFEPDCEPDDRASIAVRCVELGISRGIRQLPGEHVVG